MELMYLNNFERILVTELDKEELKETIDITEQILKIYQSKCSYEIDDTNELYVRQNENFIPLVSYNQLEDDTVIFYINIVKPVNSVIYAEENGIVYFFHTSEKTHKYNPHIHAKYGGDEISIYFNDLKVIGNFRSYKKEKVAKKYVEEHIDELSNEWNKIMNYYN